MLRDNWQPETILLVEDNLDIQELTRAFLESRIRGHHRFGWGRRPPHL